MKLITFWQLILVKLGFEWTRNEEKNAFIISKNHLYLLHFFTIFTNMWILAKNWWSWKLKKCPFSPLLKKNNTGGRGWCPQVTCCCLKSGVWYLFHINSLYKNWIGCSITDGAMCIKFRVVHFCPQLYQSIIFTFIWQSKKFILCFLKYFLHVYF